MLKIIGILFGVIIAILLLLEILKQWDERDED